MRLGWLICFTRQSGENLPSIEEVEENDPDDDDCEVQNSSMDEGFIDSSANLPRARLNG